MSALCTFAFDEQPVRVIMREDDPWFVAADVCRALAIANNRDAIARLDADERGVALTDTPGGQQNVGIINESGLYTLILRCDDAIKSGTRAHRFRKWVTSEVLPAIRKTGRYSGSEGGEDVMSILSYVREACTGWKLERQIEFGMKARRFAKAMGVVFQTRVEPTLGKCFAFPRVLLDEVRRSYQREARLPDSDAIEMERLLEAMHSSHGDEPVPSEMARGIAKVMGLFPRIFGKHTSLASERSGFGKLCGRFAGVTFPSGLVLQTSRSASERRIAAGRVTTALSLF